MKVADIIRERLVSSNTRFHANDNVSSFIRDGELALLEKELTEKFEDVLRTLIIDTETDPNSNGTAHRMAKMYLHETFKGRYYPGPKITAFPNDNKSTKRIREAGDPFTYSGLLVVRVDIKSMCSHHHQPVAGVAFIGIIPGKSVLGLSKYIRIAQHIARRGCLQEMLTQDILKAIQDASGTQDVAVYIEARHGCVENRGVGAHNSLTQTTELGGAFYAEPELRKELYDAIQLQKGVK